MKLRTTTSASISKRRKVVLVAASLAIFAIVPIQVLTRPGSAYADQYDDQIAALQSQIDGYNTQAKQLAAQAQTYQTAIGQLQDQANAIQAQIDLNQAEYNQLVAKIADTNTKIATDKTALGQTLADLYVNSQTSPLEMLASSKNISDYLDQQTYRSTIEDQLTGTIKQIQTLQQQLTQQKADMQVTLTNEQASKDALAQKQQAQQDLYNQTQGQEGAYQSLIASDKAKQADLAHQQQVAMAATFAAAGGAHIVKSGAAGDYPWNSSNCPMSGYYSTGGADGNGGDGHGYGCRQCASYAAWRMAKETGSYPTNWGDAIDFPSHARAAGYTVDYTPSANSLAVMSTSQAGVPQGHIAYVEAVYGNGTMLISQYNYYYNGWGNYTEMTINSSAFTWFIHLN